MFMDADIAGRIRAIGAFQVFAARRFFEASFGEDDMAAEDAAREVMELTFGAGILAESLGLDVATNDVLLISNDPQQVSSYLFDQIVSDRRLPDLLRELLGTDASFQLDLTRAVASIGLIAEILAGALPLRGTAQVDNRLVARERNAAIHRFGHFVNLFGGAWKDRLVASGEDRIADTLTRLAGTLSPRRWTADAFRTVQQTADQAVGLLAPHFPQVYERMSRARTIIRELKACQPGDRDWRRVRRHMHCGAEASVHPAVPVAGDPAADHVATRAAGRNLDQ
jgi:hypothetical protein